VTRGDGVPDGFGPLDSHVPFAEAAGPFLRRGGEPPGRAVFGFRATPEHGNSYAILHGGCSMTFASVTMTEAAQSLSPTPVRLVRMLTNFLAPPHAGDWVEGEAEAVPDSSGTGAIAVHVRVRVGARTVFTADAVFAPA
jgi:acyl-coenzyme A thioesterase PaaI-like protein